MSILATFNDLLTELLQVCLCLARSNLQLTIESLLQIIKSPLDFRLLACSGVLDPVDGPLLLLHLAAVELLLVHQPSDGIADTLGNIVPFFWSNWLVHC